MLVTVPERDKFYNSNQHDFYFFNTFVLNKLIPQNPTDLISLFKHKTQNSSSNFALSLKIVFYKR